jgi:hypothetical protein
MTNPPSPITILAALESLRSNHHSLIESISRLVALMKTLPEGEARDWLLNEISCLDVIAEVMRQALDFCGPRYHIG